MKNIICILFLMVGISLSAQNVAVKTNLLYDVSTTINLGAEIGLSPKWTLDLSANYNGWTFSENKKWKHWLFNPKPATGSVSDSTVTFWEHIYWAESTM